MFSFLDATHAWATLKPSDGCTSDMDCMPLSPAVVWRTDDGGQTWQPNPPYDTGDTHYEPVAIQFLSPTTGWFLLVYGFGLGGANQLALLRTKDGGASWTAADRTGFCPSRGMVLAGAQEGWISNDCRFNPVPGNTPQEFINGEAISISHTTDGGATWEGVDLPPPQVIPPEIAGAGDNGIFCGITRMTPIAGRAFSLEVSCLVGQYNGSEFVLSYLTADGGQSWRSWPASGGEYFVNAATGWRLYTEPDTLRHRVQKTADSGRTWTTVSTVTWETAQFDFVTEQVGWALVSGAGASALVQTGNGGRSWTEIRPVMTAGESH
jgi:photosystem II stability/assembly factor-like uncharacterized protein